MVKQREGYKIVILEPAKTRIENDQCPSCGLPKIDWTRRKDWRCCSSACTNKLNKFYIYYGWPDLRMKAFKRDNFTCVQCGIQPTKEIVHNMNLDDTTWKYQEVWQARSEVDDSKLIGDHIIPIALGGDEWSIDNVQTLCIPCDKVKTKQDQANIGKLRRQEKVQKIIQPLSNYVGGIE